MTATASIDSRLRLVAVAAFGAMAAMRACDPMLLTLSGSFGSSLGEASHVVSAFAIAYGILQLIYGPLGDRFGKLRVVSLASAGCAVTCGLAAAAPTLDLLIVGRILMGAAAAGVIPLTMAWIGDNVPYDQRQATLARLLTATVGGMIAGQWFGAWITAQFGWRWVFGSLMLVFVVASVPLFAFTRDIAAFTVVQEDSVGPAPARLRISNPLTLLRESRVRWVASVTALEGALVFGPLAFVPSHLVKHLGLDITQAGALLALYGVGGLVYTRFARRWLGAIGERGLVAAGGATLACSWLALAWADHWLLAVPACLFSGVGFYMLHATLQMQASQMAPARRGAAMSLFSSALFLGQSLGVVCTALAMDRGQIRTALTGTGVGLFALGLIVSRGVASRSTPALQGR